MDLESGLYTQLSLFFIYIIPNYLPWLITSFGFQQQPYPGILNLELERALGSQSPISILFIANSPGCILLIGVLLWLQQLFEMY